MRFFEHPVKIFFQNTVAWREADYRRGSEDKRRMGGNRKKKIVQNDKFNDFQ